MIRTIKSKDTSGVSLMMFIIYFIANVIALAYALLISQPPLIIKYIIALVTTIIYLILFGFYYKCKKNTVFPNKVLNNDKNSKEIIKKHILQRETMYQAPNQKLSSFKLPLISIIISVYNEEKTLRQCLDSLLVLEYPNHEVIMVNDASTDNTLAILQEYQKKSKKIKVVTYTVNKGVPGARNEGMKAAKGDIFVFTDADATFPKEWPTKLIEPFLTNPRVGATGGRDIAPPNQPLIHRCIDYTLTSFIGTAGLRGAKVRLAKYAVTGCNFAVKREVVEKVGRHDERIRWRGEEKEWCQRIREAGYEIQFVPESYILHYRRISLKSFWTQTYKSGKARFDILKAAPGSFQLIHIVPSLLVLYLVITALFSLVFSYSFALFVLAVKIYFAVLLLQSGLGMIKIKQASSFFIIPITTTIMHFAYGFGFIRKFLHD